MANKVDLYGFSSIESPEAVKKFLEELTGLGTVHAVKKFLEELTGLGTVHAVTVGQRKASQRAHAQVRFADSASADAIISLAEDGLWYGDSYLKARKSTASLCTIDDVDLHFGGRVSEDKFSVLWTREDVSVKLEEELRKVFIFMSYESMEYKLELSFDNIWEIELRCPQNRPTKFLLVQLFGGVRIFGRQVGNRSWVRDVDFSPSCCIGQSSAFCFEIPITHQLPNLHDTFVHFKQLQGRFFLEQAPPLSLTSSGLVPMLLPPQGTNLPYEILFKLNSLVQHGCIPAESLGPDLFWLVDPTRIKFEYIESALDKLYHLKHCCYDPPRWLTRQYISYEKSGKILESPTTALDQGLVYVHRVQITPTKVYFCGPEINLSNRVLRNYPDDIDNFLRVSFADEDLERLHSSDLTFSEGKERTRVYERILSVLRDGIVIGEKRFEFLAFSSSQLRENSAWMFARRDGLSAADIREWMGDFRAIRNVAKYAARLGQSFGSSREALKVNTHEVDLIPDVVKASSRGKNKYCFSDGIGKISADFAREVAAKCGLNKFIPSAFQIRYGGFKGVVAVDPESSSAKLSLRKSMSKYSSENKKLDVLAWSKYQPCYLNRQIITLLSALGVADRVFLTKQKEAVARLDAVLSDPVRAREELDMMFPGEITRILCEMLSCGFKPEQEPFLSAMLRTLRASKLLEIRSKTRIFVRDGRAMMGCLDETGTLEYGQVFVHCSSSSSSLENLVVKGNVVVAKNPCLHPGDVRVLSAIDVPELHHFVDCIVFPQKGKRPHPNECSGSDLDGDMYFVCWDCDLIPPQQIAAMDYTAREAIELDHDVTIEEVTKYFVDYILDDNLGIISNAHTVFADWLPKMAHSPKCIELAKLFSVAVDFPKTGFPAKIPRRLRVKDYPDFMEKQHKPTYKSKRVIGKLFRQVKAVEDGSSISIKSFTKQVAVESYDPEMEVDGFEDYVVDALEHKSRYDYKLGNLMDYYGIETEAELLSGNVLKRSRHYNKKRDMESANYAVKSLIKEARTWFEGGSENGASAKKASAWYHVTYHPTYWGLYNQGMSRDHFLSFAWCVFDHLCAIKKSKTQA